MSKIVDNLLGKLDQLKRKVMEDNETGDGKQAESAAAPEMKEEIAAPAAGTAEVGKESGARKKPRPRRKAAKPKQRARKSTSPETDTKKSVEQEEETKKVTREQKKSSGVKSTPKKKKEEKKPVIKLLVNAEEPEECRIALIEDGRIESFHVTTVVHEQTKGNIYKGRVAAIEPNLQAAFVDIGTERNCFLPFSEIHPEYYCSEKAAAKHWKSLKSQETIKKGQEVLV